MRMNSEQMEGVGTHVLACCTSFRLPLSVLVEVDGLAPGTKSGAWRRAANHRRNFLVSRPLPSHLTFDENFVGLKPADAPLEGHREAQRVRSHAPRRPPCLSAQVKHADACEAEHRWDQHPKAPDGSGAVRRQG